MSPSTAREKVRVALAMRELPAVTKTFLDGRLSYSKVRAITRVAGPDNDYEFSVLGVNATGAQLDKIVRAYASARSNDGPRSAWSQRGVKTRWMHEDGVDQVAKIEITLPSHDGERFRARVDAEVDIMIADALALGGGELSRKDFIASRGGFGALRDDGHCFGHCPQWGSRPGGGDDRGRRRRARRARNLRLLRECSRQRSLGSGDGGGDRGAGGRGGFG